MDGVADLTNQQASQRRLHHAFQANSVGVGMPSFDLQVTDRGHSFSVPMRDGKPQRVGRPGVRGPQQDRGARCVHDQILATAPRPQMATRPTRSGKICSVRVIR